MLQLRIYAKHPFERDDEPLAYANFLLPCFDSLAGEKRVTYPEQEKDLLDEIDLLEKARSQGQISITREYIP
jgi:hypothetical protein